MGVIVARPAPLATPAGSNNVFQEIPSGSIDGSNVSFSLAFSVNPVGSLLVIKNGLIMMSGTNADYVMSGSTGIQFNAGAIPTSGSNLFVRYTY